MPNGSGLESLVVMILQSMEAITLYRNHYTVQKPLHTEEAITQYRSHTETIIQYGGHSKRSKAKL